jgi:Ca2+-transporting ATPase
LAKGQLDTAQPRVHEIPFSPETKRMTTLPQTGGALTAYAKGAPEVILEGCDSALGAPGAQPLDSTAREQILEQAQVMAREALRGGCLATSKNT